MTEKERQAPVFIETVPPGDDRLRSVCARCGFIDYKNPKIVVGSVAWLGENVLLCRRAIDPRKGFWTLPAGFLEIGETLEQGAKREAYEEARASLEIERILAVYSVPRISQIQIMFRAELVTSRIAPGPESAEVRLVPLDGIPWPELAFPTVAWALRHFEESRVRTDFPVYGNPVEGL